MAKFCGVPKDMYRPIFFDDGRVWAEAQKHQWAAFYVELPKVEGELKLMK